MNKKIYLKLKEELKILAKTIQREKQNNKALQRAKSKHELIMSSKDYYWEAIKYNKWVELLKPVRQSQLNLYKLQAEFRAKHIIYCLERGRTIDRIEPKIKDKNDYWYMHIYCTLIPKYVQEYEFEYIDRLPKNTLHSMGWIERNGQYRLFTQKEMEGIRA